MGVVGGTGHRSSRSRDTGPHDSLCCNMEGPYVVLQQKLSLVALLVWWLPYQHTTPSN